MTTYFDGIPSSIKQTFSRVRRSSGGTKDSYGDATFTETTTTGYKGFFQYGHPGGGPYGSGETISIAGKEVSYDAIVFTGGTTVIAEGDLIVFGGSTSTAIATRYKVTGINSVYEKGAVDHREVYVEREVV